MGRLSTRSGSHYCCTLSRKILWPYRTLPKLRNLRKFTPAQRARVEARAKELIAEELTLHDLRQVQHLTQERIPLPQKKSAKGWLLATFGEMFRSF